MGGASSERRSRRCGCWTFLVAQISASWPVFSSVAICNHRLVSVNHISIGNANFINSCCTTILYSVNFFLPLILHEDMGFSRGAALCLTVPPYMFSAVTMFASGWIADKYRFRGLMLVANAVVTIVGLILLGWTKPSGVRYFSIFIINGGLLGNIPAVMAYQANNICGQWVRAFGTAAFFVGCGMGGVFGSLLFSSGKAEASASIRGILGCIGYFLSLSSSPETAR